MPHLFRRSLVALCITALLAPGIAPAHEWASPVAAAPALVPPPAQRQAPPTWSGMLWPGVSHGAPAMPSASDCKRPPASFDVAGYEPAVARQAVGPRSAPPALGGHAAPGKPATAAVAGAAAPASPAAELALSDPRARRDAPAATRADRISESDARPSDARKLEAARAESRAAAHEMHPVAPSVPGAPRQPVPVAPRPADEPVSAGMVDDNTDFGEYLAYRARTAQVPRRELDVASRVLLDVRDGSGRAVPDARVRVLSGGSRELPIWARTDAGGRAWLMPQPDAAVRSGERFEVEVSKGTARTRVMWQAGQKDTLQARLEGLNQTIGERARLDLVFLVDATGSMGDEIDKLKRSMRAVADQIARLPTQPDLCFGLVAYRDRGDEFFVRGADLTNDLGAFQTVLERLQAGGGGDYPEALNEALHTAVHRISWRGEGTARMVFLVADAPPHLDYPGPQYDQDLRAAQARGIKVFGVGASGLNPQGEYVFRQMSQFTGGRFVFLTYAQATQPSSGPGRETLHDVRNYSVETLDKLLVRLVSEDMARWPQAAP
jgi:Mg-chelatase subunit ChlD